MEQYIAKETVIYGGAFNPPTLAHQAILQACVDYAEPRAADVWLLPSASRSDKEITETDQRRLELCDALTQDVLRRSVSLQVETRELERGRATETYETVQLLAAEYPERRFTWVFGADSVATMRSWGGGEWLYENLDMLVIDRPGYEATKLGARATRLAVQTGSLSSTELRRRMASGEPYADMVGSAVGEILRQRSATLEVYAC